MAWRCGVLVPAACLLVTVPTAPEIDRTRERPGDPQEKQAQPAVKPRKTPAEQMAEPWPDAATLARRRDAAEARRLFQTDDPLSFTLAADFKAVNADRRPDSTKTFSARLTAAVDTGSVIAIPVTLSTRGQVRLDSRVCSFVPLSIGFPGKEDKGTPFDGQRKLKVITHCQDDEDYDQYVLKEYLAYRLYNLVTPRSLRVRLARATYVDAANGRRLSSHCAVFIEDEDDLARRLEGRALAIPHTAFAGYDIEALTTMMVFQYMIGNTDFSIYSLHNVHMVQTRFRPLYPFTWDFDMSGLVLPPYGAPDPRLGLASLGQRSYRGPCRSLEAFEPTFAAFRAKEAASMALVDGLVDLRPWHRQVTRQFLARFFATLRSRDALKREFVDHCPPERNTM